MEINKKRIGGVSVDAILLTVIKLVTAVLGLATTRLLSEYLSVHDYGTYSQILLIVSTISSITIFGMMDGMNYFNCRENNGEKRDAYTATIFSFQLMLGTVVGIAVVLLSAPLCNYFDNQDIKRLVFFAAVLPTLQNLLWILQVLIVSVGEARKLALRNLLVSVFRLAAVLGVVMTTNNVALFMASTVILDIAQLLFFGLILRKHNCFIRFSKVDFRLFGEIFKYCAPMAIFIMVNSINRDLDKYLVSALTDTETLALYTNASKQLPFDIFMTSFGTVLVPHIIKFFSNESKKEATKLCKLYVEITYISTGILCFAALAAAPQLMKLLYSNKYTSALAIFCIYILVDFFRFSNLTIILSSAGKTKLLMLLGIGTMALNALLNVILFNIMGLVGPAVATLLVTAVVGLVMLYYDAKVLDATVSKLIDLRYLLIFISESLILSLVFRFVARTLDNSDVHYFIILMIIAVAHIMSMFLLNGRRVLTDMRTINNISKSNN